MSTQTRLNPFLGTLVALNLALLSLLIQGGVAGRVKGDVTPGTYTNLVVEYKTVNTVNIQADGLALSDGTNTLYVTTVNVTPDISASVGANGPDAAGLDSASAWRSVWVIAKADGSSASGLFSASQTAPTMPSAYTLKRRVGWVRNDASSNFTWFVSYGPRTTHAMLSLVSAGSATSLTDVDASALAPPTAYMLTARWQWQGSLHSDIVAKASGATVHYFNVGGSTTITSYVEILLDQNRVFQYINSAAGGNVYAESHGWGDNL